MYNIKVEKRSNQKYLNSKKEIKKYQRSWRTSSCNFSICRLALQIVFFLIGCIKSSDLLKSLLPQFGKYILPLRRYWK